MSDVIYKSIKRKDEHVFGFQLTDIIIEQYLNGEIDLPECLKIEESNLLKVLTLKFQTYNNVAALNINDWICRNERGDWFYIREDSFSKLWVTLT